MIDALKNELAIRLLVINSLSNVYKKAILTLFQNCVYADGTRKIKSVGWRQQLLSTAAQHAGKLPNYTGPPGWCNYCNFSGFLNRDVGGMCALILMIYSLNLANELWFSGLITTRSFTASTIRRVRGYNLL